MHKKTLSSLNIKSKDNKDMNLSKLSIADKHISQFQSKKKLSSQRKRQFQRIPSIRNISQRKSSQNKQQTRSIRHFQQPKAPIIDLANIQKSVQTVVKNQYSIIKILKSQIQKLNDKKNEHFQQGNLPKLIQTVTKKIIQNQGSLIIQVQSMKSQIRNMIQRKQIAIEGEQPSKNVKKDIQKITNSIISFQQNHNSLIKEVKSMKKKIDNGQKKAQTIQQGKLSTILQNATSGIIQNQTCLIGQIQVMRCKIQQFMNRKPESIHQDPMFQLIEKTIEKVMETVVQNQASLINEVKNVVKQISSMREQKGQKKFPSSKNENRQALEDRSQQNVNEGNLLKNQVIKYNIKKSSPGSNKRVSYKHNNFTLFMGSVDPKDQIIDFSLDCYSQFDFKIMRLFLIQVYQRVLSSGYIRYIQDYFSKDQVKAFCSKNILHNAKKIFQVKPKWKKIQFQQTTDYKIQVIQQNKLLSEKQRKNKIKRYLEEQKINITTQKVNQLLKEITDANLKKYPQKTPASISQRIKEAVPKTNLLESDQYDFLFLNKINVNYKSQANYFSQIMIALNKMMEIPGQLVHPDAESTYFDIFKQVLTMMIIYSTQQVSKQEQKLPQYKDFLLEQKGKEHKNSRQSKQMLYSQYVQKNMELLLYQKLKKELHDIYDEDTQSQVIKIFKPHLEQEERYPLSPQIQRKAFEVIQESLKNVESSQTNEQKFFTNMFNSQYLKVQDSQQKLRDKYQGYFEDVKVKQKLKNYYVNSKLSSKAKKYTSQQIQNGQFQVNDSTILRILVKWADQLQEKFKNPNQKIYKRTELFKNNELGFTDLQELEYQQNQIYLTLVDALTISYTTSIQPFLKIVKQKNHDYQQIFGKDICKGKYINDIIANVGVFGAKLQKFTGNYIINYLNFLIHQLTQIPFQITQSEIFKLKKKQQGQYYSKKDIYDEETIKKIKNINLVTFKIGDLMRAKHSCSENQFIRFVNLIQVFSRDNSNVMKLVRVKNRLQSKDNDILMNVLFMNKIQCEFQLSLNSDHSAQAKKQKKTNQFNHYLYQISRSVLGPLSELAGILVQEDPLAADYFSKDMTNLQKNIFFSQQNNSQLIAQKTQFNSKSHKNIQKCINILPFVCQNCQKISINYNKLNKNKENKTCLDCFVQNYQNNDLEKTDQHGLSLMNKILENVTQSNNYIQHHVYTKYFKFFNYSSKKTFENVKNMHQLNQVLPEFGYFVNTSKKDQQFSIFMRTQMNQSIILFSITDQQKKQRLKQKNQVENDFRTNKTQILGIYQFKDSKKQKAWIKAIPKKYILWKCLNFHQIYNENIKFLKINQKQFLQKYKHRDINEYFNVLQEQINYRFMEGVMSQRRSQININRFAKVNDQIMMKIFKDKKKEVIHIKQFKANQAIRFSQDQKEDDKFKNWIGQLRNVQKLSLKQNNINIKSVLAIQNLQNLRYLNVSSNKLTSLFAFKTQKIYDRFYQQKHLFKLKYLNCSDNQIKQIISLQSLQQLEELYLNKNLLTSCTFVQKNKRLKILELGNNRISNISSLEKLIQLTSFNIQKNEVKTVQVCQQFEKLKTLNLGGNQQLKSIQCIQNLQQLEYLYLQNCRELQGINLFHCKKLKRLNLKNTLINDDELAKITTGLTRLKELYLNNCKNIHKIQIINFNGLKKLDLKATQITHIHLKDLLQLEELYLEQCKNMEQVNIQNCKKINTLDLNYTLITDTQLFQLTQELSQLKTIGLWSCLKLQNFKVIKNCKKLKKVTLGDTFISDNELQQITKELCQLEELSLKCCKCLSNIRIASCKKLKILDMTVTKIRRVELEELPELESLKVSDCDILSQIKIINCKNLNALQLGNTSIVYAQLQQLPELEAFKIFSCDSLSIIKIKRCKKLKTLHLSNTLITETQLQQIPELQSLNLNACKRLQRLKIKNCKRLQTLYLSNTPLISPILQELPQLQLVSLFNCQFLSSLKISNCDRIKSLDLGNTSIIDQQLVQLTKQLSAVELFKLNGCKSLSKIKIQKLDKLKTLDLGFTTIAEYLLEDCPELTELNLYGCKQLKKIQVKNCHRITHINLTSTPIKDEQLQQLILQLKLLQNLNLNHCQKLDNIKIANCKNKKIKQLDLSFTRINDAQLQLLSAQLSYVEHINLNGCQYLSKVKLFYCQRLIKLDIRNTQIESLELRQLNELKELYLNGCRMLSSLKLTKCHNVKKLDLAYSPIACDLSQIIDSLSELEKLNLSGCKQLTNIQISNSKKIKILDLSQTLVTDSDLQQLAKQLPDLQSLNLNGCKMLIKVNIMNCQRLRMMDLSFSKITEVHIQFLPELKQINFVSCLSLTKIELSQCRNIQHLDLHNLQITQCVFSQLTQLESINLSGCQQLSKIGFVKCDRLKKLDINQTPIVQIQLEQLPQLYSLDLSGCRQLQEVLVKKCQKIKILNLSQTMIMDYHLQAFTLQLPELQQLKLSNCNQLKVIQVKLCKKLRILQLDGTQITNQRVEQIVTQLSQLQQLNLRGCSQLSIFNVCNSKKLKIINLSETSVKQVHLQQMQSLKWLSLCKCELLKNIKIIKCQNINSLDISGTLITDLELQQLAKCVPQLSSLSANGCNSLVNMKVSSFSKVKNLNFGNTSLTNIQFESLLNQLAQLQVLKVNNCRQLTKLKVTHQKLKVLDVSFTQIVDIYLQTLPNLQQINLSSCNQLKSFKATDCNIIISLDLSPTSITILQLQKCSFLRQICFKNCNLLYKMRIVQCGKLKTLDLSQSHISLSTLNSGSSPIQQIVLQDLAELQLVNFNGCEVLSSLSIFKCPKTKKLDLSLTPITEVTLKYIIDKISQLQHLIMNDCRQIKSLNINRHKKLKVIQIKNTSIANVKLQQLASLQQVKLDNCKELQSLDMSTCDKIKFLDLSITGIVNIQIQYMPQLTQVKLTDLLTLAKIKINNCQKITSLDFATTSITNIQLNLLTQLDTLIVKNCKNLTHIKLTNCKILVSLDLTYTSITDLQLNLLDAFQTLKLFYCDYLTSIRIQKCKKIKKIQLKNTPVSYVQLKNMSQLEGLNLNGSKSLANLKIKNCDKMRVLDISNTPIIDGQLQSLALLEYINLTGCKQLSQIKLKNCSKIKAVDFHLTGSIVSGQFQQLTELQQIKMVNCRSLSKLLIKNCKKIKTLIIINSSLPEYVIQDLKKKLMGAQIIIQKQIQQKDQEVDKEQSLKQLQKMSQKILQPPEGNVELP